MGRTAVPKVVGMVQDVSDRKQLELQPQALVSSDMSGWPTGGRWARSSSLTGELCQRLALPPGAAFIDIDNFKAINDAHGHLR